MTSAESGSCSRGRGSSLRRRCTAVLIATSTWCEVGCGAAEGGCAAPSRDALPSPAYVVLEREGFERSEAAASVALGGAMWKTACAAGRLPEFVSAKPSEGAGFALIRVAWNAGLSPRVGVCGSTVGNVINVYQFRIGRMTGRPEYCGSGGFEQIVAHELGHWLGLADSFDDVYCGSDIMAQQNGLSHTVSAADCGVAANINPRHSGTVWVRAKPAPAAPPPAAVAAEPGLGLAWRVEY
ncbi:MAG TPA: hypothetical protein VHR45_04985 [Thermoanaerobaculia bacterium]|nr:hypothetical protein [Thermoanaerobaculia bacterium]